MATHPVNAAYNASIKTTGLVFCMDAASKMYGENAEDMTGSHTTSLVNGAAFTNNQYGSIEFDGTDDYISTDFAGTELSGSELSLDFWINADVRNSSYGIFAINGSDGLEFRMNGLRYYFFTRWNANLQTGTYPTPLLNTWMNLICVKKSNRMEIYLNGTLDSSKSVTNTSPNFSANNAIIGARGNSASPAAAYWNGEISVVRVYNQAMSAWEVSQNYNATARRYA